MTTILNIETSNRTKRSNSEGKRKIKSCKRLLGQGRCNLNFQRIHLSLRLLTRKNHPVRRVRKTKRKNSKNHLKKMNWITSLTRVIN